METVEEPKAAEEKDNTVIEESDNNVYEELQDYLARGLYPNWDSTFTTVSTKTTWVHFQLEEESARRQRKRKPLMFIATAGLQPR